MICAQLAKEIHILLKHKIKCVDCKQNLSVKGENLVCIKCGRVFKANKNGVWNFKLRRRNRVLDIYQEDQFKKWQNVFKKREVFQWSIYNSKFKRFFSQAGHRKIAGILGNREKEDFLLEVGAGNGALLDHISSKNYIGLDFSEESLKVLKAKHKKAIVICVDDNFIPFGRSSFKNIVSIHTLEHIYALGEHIQEVKRLLKTKGKYSFVIPTEGGFAFWLGRQVFTGPHLMRNYSLDVNYVMEREHINDARRVLKFLGLYFQDFSKFYWPLWIRNLSVNAMIYGSCIKHKSTSN